MPSSLESLRHRLELKICYLLFTESPDDVIQWSEWSSCSHSCGSGYSLRRLQCVSDDDFCLIVLKSDIIQTRTCRQRACNKRSRSPLLFLCTDCIFVQQLHIVHFVLSFRTVQRALQKWREMYKGRKMSLQVWLPRPVLRRRYTVKRKTNLGGKLTFYMILYNNEQNEICNL